MAGALVLLNLLASPVPAQDIPLAILALGAPVRGVPLDLQLAGADGLLGNELVTNGGFTGLAPWSPGTDEVGTGGRVTVNAEALLIEGRQTSKKGTLYAFESLAPVAAGPYRLTYRASSEGSDSSRVHILLREKDNSSPPKDVDTAITHDLDPNRESYEWTWTPKFPGNGQQARLFMRILVDPGRDQAVRFDDVSLRSMPTVTWDTTGLTVIASGGFRTSVQAATYGSYTVGVRVSDASTLRGSATLSLNVTNLAPYVGLAGPDVAVAGIPAVLDGFASTDRDPVGRLADPTFSSLGTTWKLSSNGQTGGTFVGRRIGSSLELAVYAPTQNGTVYALQTLAVTPGVGAAFRVGVRDDGGIREYQMLFRAKNATGAQTDQAYVFPPAGNTGGTLNIDWRPSRADFTSLTIYLRIAVVAGRSASAEFSGPALSAGLSYWWSLDNKTPVAGGATQEYLFHVPGVHIATLSIRDDEGLTATASWRFTVRPYEYLWALEVPPILPQDLAWRLDASASVREGWTQSPFKNGDFRQGSAGWTFSADEVGGNGTWTIDHDDQGAYAHLTAVAGKAGSVYLWAEAPAGCVLERCSVSFSYRTPDEASRLHVLLRARVSDAAGVRNVDEALTLGPAMRWTTAATEWTVPPGAKSLRVYLRFLTAPPAQASVDFRDVRIAPLETMAWNITSQAGPVQATGTRPVLSFGAPGFHQAAVTVEDAYGLSHSTTVAFRVTPLRLFPTLEGGIGVQLRDPALHVSIDNTTGLVWLLQGNSTGAAGPRLNATNEQWTLIAPDELAGRRLNLTAGQATALFDADALLRALGPATTQVTTFERTGWNDRLNVAWRLSDTSIGRASVQVLEDGQLVLVQDLRQGEQSIRLPFAWGGHTYQTRFVFERQTGETFAVDGATFGVGRNLLLLAGVLLAAGLMGGSAVILFRRHRRARGQGR